MISYFKVFWLLVFSILTLSVTNAEWTEESLKMRFKNPKGGELKIEDLSGCNSIFIMLSPECPLCQNYTLTIDKLRKAFPENKFIGVFPGKFYSKKEINAFLNKYEVKIQTILDPKYELTNYFSAKVTPEVIFLDGQGNVLYQGAIDNWAPELGKKREYPTEHFLRDAMRQNKESEFININKTEAVGCQIQF